MNGETTAPPGPSAGRRHILSIAYGCYAWIAAVSVAVILFAMLPLDDTTYQVLGMVVGIPVFMATFAVSLLGLALGVFFWREWPLPIMAGLMISWPVGYFILESMAVGDPTTELLLTIWAIAIAALMALFSIRWFLWRRHGVAR